MYKEITPHYSSNKKFNFYWGETAGFIEADIVIRFKQLCEASRNNKLKDNSVVYLTPISNYPSYKLQNYIEENKLNIKKARSWDKVDTIVIDEEFINELLDEKEASFHLIPNEAINKDKEYYLSDCYDYEKDNINRYLETYPYFIASVKNVKNNSDFNHFSKYPVIKGIRVEKRHGNSRLCKNIDFILDLFENIEKYGIHVVLDSSINKDINKDTVIDLDIYENLYSMLASSDEGNYKLAAEIIANCEYEASRPYIVFLASIFACLNKKSSNRNYHAVYAKLRKEKILHTYSHTATVKQMLAANPEYKDVICGCLKIHLNHLYKTEIVKEVLPI